jgi:hypothetical protein
VIVGEGTVLIRATPKEILEFVLDLERYRRADTKIGRVHWLKRDGDRGRVKHGGRLRGVPGRPLESEFTLTPWTRLEFRSVRAPWPLAHFEGLFTCEETPDGTRVHHREAFGFRGLLAGAIDRFLGRWLAQDTPREMERMRAILEQAQE